MLNDASHRVSHLDRSEETTTDCVQKLPNHEVGTNEYLIQSSWNAFKNSLNNTDDRFLVDVNDNSAIEKAKRI